MPNLPARLAELADDIPWFLPGFVLTLAIAALLAAPLSRRLQVATPVGWLLVTSLGVIVAATLTPIASSGGEQQTCDLSRIALAPFRELRRVNDTSLNVALFVPLGAAVALLPGGSRRVLAVSLAGLLPAGIEAVQWLLPGLGRGCQSADVVDNVTGLVIGVLAVGAMRLLLRDDRGGAPRRGASRRDEDPALHG